MQNDVLAARETYAMEATSIGFVKFQAVETMWKPHSLHTLIEDNVAFRKKVGKNLPK